MMTRLPFGQMNDQNAVFVGFYVRSKLYQDYDYVSQEVRDQEHTQILLLMRWDGRLGFPGGRVDPGEELIDAALREVREEIHFLLVNGASPQERATQQGQLRQRLQPIGAHELRAGFTAHFLSCEITPAERDYIRANSHLALHANAEVAGVNFVHCFDLPNKGLSSLLEHGLFVPGVRDELAWLLETHGIDVVTPHHTRAIQKLMKD